MDNIHDYETENLCLSLDGNPINLTEKIWHEQFAATGRGPYSHDSELHQLLKGAYQQIKLLEREKKTYQQIYEKSLSDN